MIEPDEDAIKTHLDQLCEPARWDYPDGLVEICHGPATNPASNAALFSVSEAGVAEAVKFAVSCNRRGENIYVGVNPRKRDTNVGKRAADTAVEIAFFHFADLDEKDAVERARAGLPLRPTMIVMTGTEPHNRPHFYWRLNEPVMNLDAWRDRQQGIAQSLGGDAVINPSRIMRLAGTVNFPTQKKVEKGYRVEPTTIRTSFPTERPFVTPEQVAMAFPQQNQVYEASVQLAATGIPTLGTHKGVSPAAYLDRIRAGDHWHENSRDLVAHWIGIGWCDAEIMAIAAGITLPGFTLADTERSLRSHIDTARRKYMVPDPDIEVHVTPGEIMPLVAVDAFDFDEAAIPVRPWLIRGVLMERHTHILVAPGGSGKSLFTLQLGITLATGRPWGSWAPTKRAKTLVINVEDDLDEQRRRLSGARTVMQPEPTLLHDMMSLAVDPASIVVARIDPKTRSVVTTPVVSHIIAHIRDNGIQCLIVDPFAETFEGDENSNSEVKWAMKIWRDVARQTGCAVYLVHHTTKYTPNGAGNADVARGGGAITNSTRVASTLFVMTEDEAKALGIDPMERDRYVRFDDAKANNFLKSRTARWFQKISVTIGNGGGLNSPDEVGALKPWLPPGAFDGCSRDDIHIALLLIDRGLEDGDGRPSGTLFTQRVNTQKGTSNERWVGHPIMAALGVNEERAKLIAKEWLDNGMLVEAEYDDPGQRKPRNGLTVNADHLKGFSG